jgi:hypothetical protein
LKAIAVGDRVTWTGRDHGKDKTYRGQVVAVKGKITEVELEGTGLHVSTSNTVRRCRGRKPQEKLPW